MQFKDIVGQRVLINNLTRIIDSGRVSHAQMMMGKMGYGTMALAMAYVQYLFCEHRVHHGEDAELRADSCGECPNCKKLSSLTHPDVHLFFPSMETTKVKKACCENLREDFHKFLLENDMYDNIEGWYSYAGVENNQGKFRELDVKEIGRLMSMKPYEGKMRALLLWMPELMDEKVANELLKTLEEPYDNTLLMLVGESCENMLETVRSRVQRIDVPRIIDAQLPPAAEGNYMAAKKMQMESASAATAEMSEMFVSWMRLLFKLQMLPLSQCVEKMAKLKREPLKIFLRFASERIAECFRHSMTGGSIPANLNTGDAKFDQMFPAMITVRNAEAIDQAFTDAIYVISRNVTPKLVLMQLSFTLSKCLKNR